MKKKTNTASSEMLICPICGKKFEPDENTKYIIGGGYTCDWKCFFNETKRREAIKKKESKT